VSDPGSKRRWLHWVVLVATVLLLALFARKVDWAHAWSAITHADPVLLGVATIANLGTLVVKGLRWSLFLDAVGIHGTAQTLRTTFAGHALNNVLVANGGDAVRVAATARNSKVSSATVLATLAIDKMPLSVPSPRGSRFGSPLVLSRVHWVRPEMVVEVSYVEWTPDGLLRHVVYLGEREDKPAIDVRREPPRC